MSIIDLNGKPISSVKEAVAGVNLVEAILELSDPDSLRKAKPLNIQTPQGVIPMMPEKILPDLLGGLYQFMISSGQKQLTLTITDKSLPTIPDKRFDLKIKLKPFDQGKDYDLYVIINKWFVDYREHYTEKQYANNANFCSVLCDMFGIDEDKAQELINKYVEINENISDSKM